MTIRPIGAELKPEELTRLGGSDRARKKCSAIMEPNSSAPYLQYTNTQVHNYRHTKTQIQIHKYTSDRARKKYTAIMEARLNSSTPSFPLLHCTKLGGKVTFMLLQMKLSQNRCNAILFIQQTSLTYKKSGLFLASYRLKVFTQKSQIPIRVSSRF